MNTPYTDDDLRAEAARQLNSARNAPFATIMDRMAEAPVASTPGTTYSEALETPELMKAAERVQDYMEQAADLARYAVDLGAAGLHPGGDVVPVALGDPNGDSGRVDACIHVAVSGELSRQQQAEVLLKVARAVSRLM